MTKEIDPSEMTDEEIDELADDVKRQNEREASKYGHLLGDDDE